jgi:hypothetical protein
MVDEMPYPPVYAAQQQALAAILEEQCARKRLAQVSGQVPGQPTRER